MNKKIFVFLALTSLILSTMACALLGPPAIKEAFMSLDEAGETPTSAFSPEDDIYCQVKLKNSLWGDQLEAVWSVVNVSGARPGEVISEHQLESAGPSAYFGLTNPDPWPEGEYQVEVYINGALGATVFLEVLEP